MKRIMYVRDSKRNPVGCIVINVDRQSDTIQYQLSTAHDLDLKANKVQKKTGVLMATERLESNPISISNPTDTRRHVITTAVMEDLAAAKKAPRRVREFAQRWLKKTAGLNQSEFVTKSWSSFDEQIIQKPNQKSSLNDAQVQPSWYERLVRLFH